MEGCSYRELTLANGQTALFLKETLSLLCWLASKPLA